jgi:CheY-like chemotaxis protein
MKKIFIIDDDDMYQLVLKRNITKVGIGVVVESYSNGALALAAIEQLRSQGARLPEIILLDINMPVMDGWQFMSKMEELMLDEMDALNIFMVSTSLDNRDKDKASKIRHIKEYIFKPIPPDKLREIISA